MPTRGRVSEHFVVEEFDCHNGQRCPGFAIPALAAWAAHWGEPLRARFGPVSVTSGFRPEAYNRSVGGARSSVHVYDASDNASYRALTTGVAADVTCKHGTPADWQAWALARPAFKLPGKTGFRGGVGRYATFVHLDTGPRRTWAG